jgi:cystathionine beta-lyase/cystathionine gamma-synthase
MDNYIANYLFQHPDLDASVKNRIKHFQYQYLTKVSNICPLDALNFEQSISPWASLSRGDYHRFYHRSPFLQAIEEAIAHLKQECDLFLLSDRVGFDAFLKACRYEAVKELFSEARSISVKGVDVLLVPKGGGKAELIHEFIVEKGFTPTLQRAAGLAAHLSLKQPNLSYEFPKQNPPELSFSAFVSNPIFLQFKKLGESDFLASVLVDLFEGLAEVDDAFQKRGVHSLLQDSYGRALRFLEEALLVDRTQYVNAPQFESLLDLANEEILLWLTVAAPYSESMLEELIQKTMVSPAFFKTTSTGMAAFSEILKVVLESEPTILLFDGCYFENRSSLLKSYPPEKFYLVRSPDYAASLQENLKQSIDLLFINFHENILEGRLESSENRVGDVIAQLFESGCVGSSLKVVIDHTIGFLDAPEIRELLERFQEEINLGALHIIVLRSHQKFDLFGFDKVSGGSYCVYSSDSALLLRFQSSRCDEMDTVSTQVLAHHFATAPQKLEERRERIFSNAHYIYERIADGLKYKKGAPEQRICVVLKEDRQNFSIDVQCAIDLEDSIGEAFAKRGVPLAVRSGFGFNLTTVAFTRFKLLRFSIGIEDCRFVNQFVKAFNSVFVELN